MVDDDGEKPRIVLAPAAPRNLNRSPWSPSGCSNRSALNSAWSSLCLLLKHSRKDRPMLKVTQTNSHGRGAIVKLEGKLLQPWVDEVRALFLPPVPGSLPRLDLASLTFVDAAGVDLLRQLLGQGVAIESCSPFVAALLQLNHK